MCYMEQFCKEASDKIGKGDKISIIEFSGKGDAKTMCDCMSVEQAKSFKKWKNMGMGTYLSGALALAR